MFVYQFLVCLFVEKFRVKIKHACEFIAEQEQERDRGFTHGAIYHCCSARSQLQSDGLASALFCIRPDIRASVLIQTVAII